LKLCLTSLDILTTVKELSFVLISARIENIYQLDGGDFLFKFHAKDGPITLIVTPGMRANITRFKYPIPNKPSSRAANLRKLLNDSKIESVGQIDFDRILFLETRSSQGRCWAYFELFGDGNLIVADEAGIIRFALESRSMKDRTIRLGVRYLPPPQRGLDVRSDHLPLEAIRAQNVNLIRATTRTFNLPPEVAEEALYRSSLDPYSAASSLDEQSLALFAKKASALVDEAGSGVLKPCIALEGGKYVNVLPLDFLSVKKEKRCYATFNEAIDEYFALISREGLDARRRSPIEDEIQSFEAILSRQKAHITGMEQQKVESTAYGKLILSHMVDIQALISSIVGTRRSGKDWSEIKPPVGIVLKGIDKSKGIARIAIGERELDLDFKLNATGNAELFFAKSKEAAQKLEGLKVAVSETEKKISNARAGLLKVKQIVIARAMKKEWFEKFRWTYSTQGFLIIGGRDSTQNEVLFKKHLGQNDIFAHADMPGGSVVLVKSEGKAIPDETKEEAVSFAVAFSKSWKSGVGVADGYWVNADQVSKTPPSGEYIGKGAFMIYGSRNYLRNIALSIRIGIKLEEEGYKVIVGNEAYVSANSNVWLQLKPGELEGTALVRKIKDLLAEKGGSEVAQIIKSIPEGDILTALPPGGASF